MGSGAHRRRRLPAYCTAAGIFVSPAYTEQKPASEVLKQLLELALADAIWSGGKLKVIPYADAAITGVDENGDPITWTPPSAGLRSHRR
jgi:hypothetical protein